MKKIVMAVCAFGLALGCAKAQKVLTDNVDGTQQTTATTSDDSSAEGSDFRVEYNSDYKLFGIGASHDLNKNMYIGLDASYGFDDLSSSSLIGNIGLKKRYVFNNSFLIQGKIGPYAGWYSYETIQFNGVDKYGNAKNSKKTENEFTWGVNASIAGGIRLWNTPKGNSTFLTIGYYINARELKTEKVIENGSWGLGFTTIFK